MHRTTCIKPIFFMASMIELLISSRVTTMVCYDIPEYSQFVEGTIILSKTFDFHIAYPMANNLILQYYH